MNALPRAARGLALCGAALTLVPATAALRADDTLAGKACRSVHLSYQAEESAAYYNEVIVDRSAPGTYFCVCGFSMGYFGIQELGNGKKVAIFSVWDPGDQDDPDTVNAERRVKLVAQGETVRIGRFGNEGTGGQSFLDLDWQPGETYRFLVTARRDGDRTEYAAYIAAPAPSRWLHLATFSTLANGALLKGHYAFVEDFKRDRVSATRERRARFGPAWVRTPAGAWVSVDRVRFTADSNPATSIDAGVAGARMYLATGGETRNEGTRLRDWLARPEEPPGSPPQDLPVLDLDPVDRP